MNYAINYDEAVDILLRGGVGVMPTDTVYGLVVCAYDKDAVSRFYSLKNRKHKPGTIIAASTSQLADLGVDELYLRRVERWWPGPLSVETPMDEALAYLHQDMGRQALRVVADEQMREVLMRTGPLVTSSANKPGEPGAVNIEQSFDYFKNIVDFYVDGGDLSDRAPSTIIRFEGETIEVIREGALKIDASWN